ncbi:MAG: hypothetical protein H6738_25710 [Alphaproteobacteria bacterium]|nr:hypothetical protein [Alphaproteobacteria bacterium]
MMERCDRCGTLTRAEGPCPHCGATGEGRSDRRRVALAILLGLTLAGCPPRAEPPYGVTTMTDGPTTDTADTGDP